MSFLYAQEILKPETVTAILELGQKAEQIADRWAMGGRSGRRNSRTKGYS